MASGSRVAGVIRSLVNARDLQLECARVLHETFMVSVHMYGSETILWKEKRSTIRAVQMDNLRGFLDIMKMSPDCTDKGTVRSDEGGIRNDW